MRLAVHSVIAFCAALGIACAADWGTLQPEGHVNDFAKVLTPKGRGQLETYCRAIKQSTGAEIALVTIPSLDGEPIEDVANYLFRHWGVGNKETKEGVLVLLAIRDRRSRVEIGYGLEPYITDGFAGSVLRSMRTPLRAGSYDDALAEAAMTIGDTITRAKGGAAAKALPRKSRRSSEPGLPFGPLAGAALIFALIFFAGRGRRGGRGGRGPAGADLLAGMLIGQMLGGGRFGPRGGGGFGGYDSSDSFGGFGGGDSGGGGASSDW